MKLKALVSGKAKLVVIAVLGAGVGVWLRQRTQTIDEHPVPGNAAWPPLQPVATTPAAATPAQSATPPAAATPTRSAANAGWVAADANGDCPVSHPIKAKDRSGIHHQPGDFSYERTNADRCYTDAAAAEADGYRAAKR